MKKVSILFLLLNLVIIQLIKAQNDSIPELVTDRPDQTESSITVPKGSLQIESGFVFTNTKNSSTNTNEMNMGSTLLRYGVFENFELRLSSYYGRTSIHYESNNTDSTFSGLGAVTAGFKVFIHEEEGWIPEFSILANITLRHLGHKKFHPTYSYPSARLSASHTLSDKLSFGYNFGFAYDGEIADGFFIYSSVLGYSITPGIGFYVEVFGDFDNSNYPHHILDGGFTFKVRHNLQLDISAGTVLTSESDSHFLNTGFSWRIPR